MTIKEALTEAAKTLVSSDSCVLDSEVLLAFVLNKNRSYFRAWPDELLTTEKLDRFQRLVKQRQKGQPIAYLVGEREFWSRRFIVSKDVLIPRPDTELLIEITHETFATDQHFSVLDLGTGSGAIAITLALEFPNASVTAVDNSQKALAIAEKNALQHKVHNIQFLRSDWFETVPNTRFDLIISNPPYICPNDPHLLEGDLRFEPSSALIAQHEGLQDLEHITSQAKSFLKHNGLILFEHGFQQGTLVKNLLELYGFKSTQHFQDIQGHVRATLGTKP